MQSAFHGGEGEGPIGGYESQIYSDGWAQGEPDSGEEDSLAKVDRALAMEVNIPLDHKGELVSFREVRCWKAPTIGDLTRLKNRINEEWIKPLNLKQQDIVRASGLGAPYVCYLLKDPNSPNMNRRRKIEAYSVLTELFRKYDAKIITKEDFIRLRNQRVANRFQGPRQDRSARTCSGQKTHQRRRRRRNSPYGDEEIEDDDEGSTIDEDMNDPNRGRRKRRGYQNMPGFGAYDMGGMYMNMQEKMYMYPGVMPGGYGMPTQYHQPTPWVPSANVPYYPAKPYAHQLACGKSMNEAGKWSEAREGRTFIAPYSANFPQVARTLFSLSNLVDGPPPCYTMNANANNTQHFSTASSKDEESNEHNDINIRKISSLHKSCVVSGVESNRAVLRDPTAHAFMFLIERNSCLLPIGIKFHQSNNDTVYGNANDNIWDLQYLRNVASTEDWLSESRDWDNNIWVLWDIKECSANIGNLLDRWKREQRLSDSELTGLTRSFLSQYVYLRDVEMAFHALLEHAGPGESFVRAVEINCDLLEERLRVKDSFMWDIRTSDWELAALLSNFVSDFHLDAPAISSLFIDLKTTVLRYKKEWIQSMLERMTSSGKIQPAKIVPDSIGISA